MFTTGVVLLLGGLFLGPSSLAAAEEATVADTVTLRDGSTLSGQATLPDSRRRFRMVLRREWVVQNLPERLPTWEDQEKRRYSLYRQQRSARLRAWKSERGPRQRDLITNWIETSLAELDPPKKTSDFPLLAIELEERQVARVSRRQPATAAMLRQAWRAGFPDPESLTPEKLKPMLQGRGFATSGVDSAPVDDLMAPFPESEQRWLLRRAVTEVEHDTQTHFIRYLGLVLPQDAQANPAIAAQVASEVLKHALEGSSSGDPLSSRLASVASSGQRGARVTNLVIAPDSSAARVEVALWVRALNGQWSVALRQVAQAQIQDTPPAAGEPLAVDPQIEPLMNLLESLGDRGRELRSRSLQSGAAVRDSLTRAQAALAQDTRPLLLPVTP